MINDREREHSINTVEFGEENVDEIDEEWAEFERVLRYKFINEILFFLVLYLLTFKVNHFNVNFVL